MILEELKTQFRTHALCLWLGLILSLELWTRRRRNPPTYTWLLSNTDLEPDAEASEEEIASIRISK